MPTLGGSARRNPRGADFKQLSVGGGDLLYKVSKVTAAVNPADLATLTKNSTAVTVAGVKVGDIVVAVPPAALEDDLIPAGAIASGANEVTVYLYNASGINVDGASLNWDFLVFSLS